ncbi:hypothetical protein G647_07562 [Cladophialophora carrionii CBS 160.54]|uniref:tRNA-splicing endonuclease subunit Sen54 N-terminal domain-containing protein n=1 Tax=Cladophialophora carrionii CBS 160.54 TaxID=1279043 RepID=V9D5D7_9EURO|nr:uncharacterized protein G647_07562 [Cladophialophora carrionii CBS 160.54]ETI21217.1 hypothetical protein G647_07562 [Cladophialophora carrionii CBS 160.54]
MADADEDAIPRTSTTDQDDLEDETQDFRFLNQITAVTRTGQTTIPKRGTKDFEPNPTRSQSSALDASRLAMHTALSSVRIHAGKNHVVGQYLPNEGDWRWDEDDTGARQGRCVVVPKFKSTHSKVMGVGDRNNWTWFLPEEALWLLERGNLDIRWPDAEVEDILEEAQRKEEENEKDVNLITSENGAAAASAREPQLPQDGEQPELKIGDLPMSVQGAYASLIGTDGLTLERYTVYAGLKRAGYIVHRAPTWHDTDAVQPNGHNYENVAPSTSSLHTPSPSIALLRLQPQSTSPRSLSRPSSAISNIASLIHRLVSYLFRPQRSESCSSLGPLVAPGLYRNYADIFRALALIPYHDGSSSSHSLSTGTDTIAAPNDTQSQSQRPQPPYRIHFHVWKPAASSTFKKTSPPPPDYRICVIDARTTPSIPSLAQIGRLLDSQPEDFLTRDKAGKLETRIKYGKRNVLLAVVDMGVVSYLRLSDACFGAEKLFEEKIRAGTKGARRPQGKGKGQAQGQGRRPGQTKQI